MPFIEPMPNFFSMGSFAPTVPIDIDTLIFINRHVFKPVPHFFKSFINYCFSLHTHYNAPLVHCGSYAALPISALISSSTSNPYF